MTVPTQTRENDLEKLRDLIKAIDFCMLTTVDEGGALHSRPMSSNGDIDADGDIWFFTNASSHKVSEIEKLPKVNVSFADPDNQRYVSVSGTAQLVSDRAKIDELWRPEFKIWFPEGKDDPEIALLRVSLEKAEYWDSPSSTIGYALSFVSSLVTGKQPDLGENRKVDLQ
ncbi:MAG TPA: pyridoxamine 5'-phosphate oxidase family protein [Pyrinomonadaceae bacterium]|jgi:general stress protein 26|nr:pyridoxamine 5'-phosphate oxidase family protein [Pyrinomonadaceae bacterium]